MPALCLDLRSSCLPTTRAVNVCQSRFACARALGTFSQTTCAPIIFALRLASRTAQHLRKEVIQPHLPIRLPCYDFTPVIAPALDGCLLAVGPPALGVNDFRGVTGGVYKARERIHRSMLTCDY